MSLDFITLRSHNEANELPDSSPRMHKSVKNSLLSRLHPLRWVEF